MQRATSSRCCTILAWAVRLQFIAQSRHDVVIWTQLAMSSSCLLHCVCLEKPIPIVSTQLAMSSSCCAVSGLLTGIVQSWGWLRVCLIAVFFSCVFVPEFLRHAPTSQKNKFEVKVIGLDLLCLDGPQKQHERLPLNRPTHRTLLILVIPLLTSPARLTSHPNDVFTLTPKSSGDVGNHSNVFRIRGVLLTPAVGT